MNRGAVFYRAAARTTNWLAEAAHHRFSMGLVLHRAQTD